MNRPGSPHSQFLHSDGVGARHLPSIAWWAILALVVSLGTWYSELPTEQCVTDLDCACQYPERAGLYSFPEKALPAKEMR